MSITAMQAMGRAKADLVLEQAFFASIICSMKMIPDTTLNPPTMATNGKVVKYHPQFVDDLNALPDGRARIKFVLCHEVGHCMLQHMFRRGSRDHKKWNQAGDYVINDMLTDAKIGVMPEGGLLDRQLVVAGGGTTDGVYNLLPDATDDGSGGQSNGHGDPMDNCEDADGTPAEQAEAEADMMVRIVQAANAAKMCGQLPASLERLIDGALKPKVDWKDVLRRFVSASAKTERSYARPQRRFMSQGIYLPSLRGQQMGEIMVWIDVSGSIGERELSEFFAELQGIKADVNPSVMHVGYFHHDIAGYDRFEQDDDLELRKTGSGGTAFSPCFRYMEDHEIEPVCTVVLTDLCCHDFGPQPDHPVLWVSTCPGSAPWGEVVLMNGAR